METLLIGNTGYVTKEFIQDTFPEDSVVVIGSRKLKTDKKCSITSYPVMSDDEKKDAIMDGYRFERVVCFSNYLTFNSGKKGELEKLRELLCRYREIANIQIVYITSLEGDYTEKTGKSEVVRASESFCMNYAKDNGMQVKILRVPFLYSAVYEEDYIYKKLKELEETGESVWAEAFTQPALFLDIDDLGRLLFRVFDTWDGEREILNAPDMFGLTFGNLENVLKKIKPSLRIRYADEKGEWSGQREVLPDDKILRRKYGWAQRISIENEISELYCQIADKRQKPLGKVRKAVRRIKKNVKLLKYAELWVGAVLMEILAHMTGDYVQFKMIDVRLLFIVVMGTIYGLDMGIGAAILASISLVTAKMQEGTNWITLFYEPANWIPFIAYFVTGAICGYVKLKNQDDIKFVKRENELLQDKFLFMKSLYSDTLQDKRKYKKQIMGSRDSFGKIFEVTRELDVLKPQEVFEKAIRVMEEVLDNKTVAIYSVGKNKSFGRLEVCSRNLNGQLANSIRLSEYEQALIAAEKGEVWSNTKLLEGYPAYLTGVRDEKELVLLIMIWNSSYKQLGLYYVNLLRILCGLVESSLLRAMNYQKILRNENYVEGTNIFKESYFLETLKIRHDMMENHMAQYILVKLNKGNMSLQEASGYLETRVRENDIVGLSGDGTLYLILARATHESAHLVMERLDKCGFSCRIVNSIEEIK